MDFLGAHYQYINKENKNGVLLEFTFLFKRKIIFLHKNNPLTRQIDHVSQIANSHKYNSLYMLL